jgi:putative membrane protein
MEDGMNRIAAAALALAFATAACGGSDDGASESGATPADTTAAAVSAAPAPAGAVTDPQIAAIVVAANDVDIAAGQLARERGSNAEVKAFAERMVTDHTGVNKAATDLVTRLGVAPEPNATSQQLTSDGEAARQRLQGQSGAAFDRAYIDQEVAYHQAVLDAIDQTLIPGAQNAELKALLEQTRPAVAAHLEHARRIQGTLGGA